MEYSRKWLAGLANSNNNGIAGEFITRVLTTVGLNSLLLKQPQLLWEGRGNDF